MWLEDVAGGKPVRVKRLIVCMVLTFLCSWRLMRVSRLTDSLIRAFPWAGINGPCLAEMRAYPVHRQEARPSVSVVWCIEGRFARLGKSESPRAICDAAVWFSWILQCFFDNLDLAVSPLASRYCCCRGLVHNVRVHFQLFHGAGKPAPPVDHVLVFGTSVAW